MILVSLNGKDKEVQFNLGAKLYEQQKYHHAEHWLRYAALQGHAQAQKLLSEGTQQGYFINTTQRINQFAIAILETLLTPIPSQLQIDELESAIKSALSKVLFLNHSVGV